jgi:hypothetical protein
MLEAEKIKSNWEEYRAIVNTMFPTRKVALNKMYDEFEERMVFMPASGVEHYHNAFAGGYVDHILRVIQCAESLHFTWTAMGSDMSGYTKEELVFAAMHHDLGKIGFPGEGNVKCISIIKIFRLQWYQIYQFGCYKNMMLNCHGPNINRLRYMMVCMMMQINHISLLDRLKLN